MESDTERKERMNERNLPDSFKLGSPSQPNGALSVYFDLEDLAATERKLKNFFKINKLIEQLRGV